LQETEDICEVPLLEWPVAAKPSRSAPVPLRAGEISVCRLLIFPAAYHSPSRNDDPETAELPRQLKMMSGSRWQRLKLCTLFCAQAHGIGLWYVPFSNVLRAHGLEMLTPYAFACSSVAAFISPMLVATLADRHLSAERILRWLLMGGAVFLALTALALERGWGGGWVLAMLQIEQLCAAPTWSLSTSIVLASLDDPERQFGPIRVWATFGWMASGLLLSFVLHADSSTVSGYAGALVWVAVGLFTLTLPKVQPSAAGGSRRWRDVMGWDAFVLLRDRDHRAVFASAALLSIPLAAFYPFTVMHLRDLGEPRVSAAMALGQVSEVIAMYALAPLLARFPFKSILVTGIAFGVLRYILFALNTRTWLLVGISLHGFCFTLFFIAAQIYLERRVERQFRTRAQALMTLMMAGVGNFTGALGTGWLRQSLMGPGGTAWNVYWLVLSGVTACVGVFFITSYRGRGGLSPGRTRGFGDLPAAAQPLNGPMPE
jgi:nucleoside transporter